MWFYWMHWRPTLWEDMTPDEDAEVTRHSGYVKQLYDEGRIVLAGAVLEPATGLVFFNADGEDEARAIMEADPVYAAQIVEVTLHQFNAGFVGGVPFDYTEAGAAGSN